MKGSAMELDSETLEKQWPARESQIKQLSVLLSVSEPSDIVFET